MSNPILQKTHHRSKSNRTAANSPKPPLIRGVWGDRNLAQKSSKLVKSPKPPSIGGVWGDRNFAQKSSKLIETWRKPSRKPRLAAIASLAALFLAACSSPDSSPDSSPSESSASANAESTATSTETPTVDRVVVLSSLAADLIAELDVSRLVGVPNSSLVQQNPQFAEIETMGVGQTPNLEAIVQQQPDLVIGVAGMQTEILTRLEELGIATLEYDVNSLADLDELALTLADRLNTSPEAVRDRYASCQEIPETGSEASVLLLAGSKPILSPTRDSWAGNLMETFKVNNLAAQWQGESPFSGYVTLSPEKIVAADPDRLWVIATPDNADPLESFKALAFWDDLQATEGDRVRVFDYYGLINPGSLDQIEATCAQLNDSANDSATDAASAGS